jgi:outer membrane beta-barrel protein
MKRLAICLSLGVALVGWTATGHAKKGGGKGAAPAADGSAAGGEGAAAEGGDKAAGKEGAATESLDTSEDQAPAKIEEDITGPKAQRPTTTLSWQDIVVVPRKAFLKGGRLEIAPIAGITINDNLLRHYMFALDINYFLTDALWVGLQGQYFVKQLTTQADLVGLQFNRLSTMNRLLYGGAFNMGYVPVYGKFAWFNKSILHWEIWASGGVGVTQTEVIARDPADQGKAFQNTALTPNFGLGSRFFLTDWLTVNFAIRDYLIIDRLEAVPDPDGMPPECTDKVSCKSAADSALVNNFIAYIGVGMYLPTKFTYKTPR